MPVTFITGSVGDVEPGEEFTVLDELASAFLTRSDVEEVVTPAVEEIFIRRRHVKEEPGQSAAADGGDPEKTSEENGDVPNDH
jgi:hypothetical protein